ncbi:MAG TPA: hypothetical protein DCL44_00590 [Elusimicrobia bacterium]|nr:hypothetical protein [Elusimicrobiota bacterium]
MSEGDHLDSLVIEYKTLLRKSVSNNNQNNCDEKHIIENLTKSADWSPQGANEILGLVNNYGAFILRNALAIAVALGKEDGALGL